MIAFYLRPISNLRLIQAPNSVRILNVAAHDADMMYIMLTDDEKGVVDFPWLSLAYPGLTSSRAVKKRRFLESEERHIDNNSIDTSVHFLWYSGSSPNMTDTILVGWQRRPSDTYINTGYITEAATKDNQFAAPLHVCSCSHYKDVL